ncbi:SGNH hydrolase-type esterase domain-containing protein [Aspergillus ambiguus]|uniref:rhamnogalacturonan acetylesterase n=1 Tax=Aspergillus ambiguus TaxID=176160 RepID=UPI003CCD1A49
MSYTMHLALQALFFLGAYATPSYRAIKPPFFLLAGDSTTATQSSNGGGWGDGFINTTLFSGAGGLNFGHNGATTVSFRDGGDWDNVLSELADHKARYNPYVTIQFGHNDQKTSAGISIAEYTSNLEQFAADVQNAGGTPILVTPLSRRNYDNSSGTPTIIENLADQRAATIDAAETAGVAYIDLNRASTDYLNSIGPQNAYTYNLNADDQTHLNVQGSRVFGGMVAELILGVLPSLGEEGYVEVDPELLTALQDGEYYWPE